MQLNEQDIERFEEMTHRLELTHVWTELGSCVTPGWLVIPGRLFDGEHMPWRAYPISRVKGEERHVSHFSNNLLRDVTGFGANVYTVADMKLAQDKALLMLMVFSPRVQA